MSSSGDVAARAQIIHHCDSVFGTFLVALVFLSSVTIGIFQRYRPEAPSSSVIAIAVLASFGILVGFLAILLGSWGLRMGAWWSASYFLLFLIAILVRLFIYETYGSVAYALSAFVQIFVLGMGPPIIALRAMAEYRHRLASVYCSDRALDFFVKNRWFWTALVVVSIIMAYYAFLVLDVGYAV